MSWGSSEKAGHKGLYQAWGFPFPPTDQWLGLGTPTRRVAGQCVAPREFGIFDIDCWSPDPSAGNWVYTCLSDSSQHCKLGRFLGIGPKTIKGDSQLSRGAGGGALPTQLDLQGLCIKHINSMHCPKDLPCHSIMRNVPKGSEFREKRLRITYLKEKGISFLKKLYVYW